MSDDLIKRSDAIDAIHSYWKDELNKMPMTDSEYGKVIDGDCDTLLKHNKELSTRIKNILSADRPQGKWISKHNGYWTCSECGLSFLFYAKGNYCPNCGADMKGKGDE